MADRRVSDLMQEYARLTGLFPACDQAERYLWTDAFAVCNYLSLFRETSDGRCRDAALHLVDEVHHTLGRHRPDDFRRGWISGCGEEEGERHPTWGGLRIGKPLPEREMGEPYHEQLEWERDGQYYHYLTKWMHALSGVAMVTGDVRYLRWAMELARAIHPRFISPTPSGGRKRMFWKMRTDLSAPLVPLMGQHDPIDGFVTYLGLQSAAERLFPGEHLPDMQPLIADIEEICRGTELVTDDPLGIGGLLFDATRISVLAAGSRPRHLHLLETVLEAVLAGLSSYAANGSLRYPAEYRLAFRELGLAIGLAGVAGPLDRLAKRPDIASRHPLLVRRTGLLKAYEPMRESINRFWLDKRNHDNPGWIEHPGINLVMLATSLAPGAFLEI